MKSLLVFFMIFSVFFTAYSQSVKEAEVRQAFERWTEKSPHFKRNKTPFVKENYLIKTLNKQTLDSGSMPFYAVEIEPEGFMIMSSDKRLPPVIAYSDTGPLNLDDLPENAFRALLKSTMDGSLRKLLKVSTASVTQDLLQPLSEAQNVAEWEQLATAEADDSSVTLFSVTTVVTNGPFLTTAWNQNNHYNELCPEDPDASDYYDGRAPAGCVAVVGAQIMNYYKWPYRGSGGNSYTDSEGSIGGSHDVDFSDPYDWANMQDSYYAWGTEPAGAVAAVSELMYEVGVAIETDYEHSGSAAYVEDLGARMPQSFLYDRTQYLSVSAGNSSSIADQIRGDMQADRPAVLSISGHAIVADGYYDDGNSEFFHINYGWGSSANTGWFLVDAIPDGRDGYTEAVGCISGIYPAMIPLNATEGGQTNSASNIALEWTVANVRTADVQSVSVLHQVVEDETFSDSAEDFSNFSITSGSLSKDWEISDAGFSGDCFYKKWGGYSYDIYGRAYHLTSVDKFLPAAGSQLKFQLKARLSTDVFQVFVSEDDGQTWSEEYSLSEYENRGLSWQWVELDLSSYAGSEISIRFEYRYFGSYYSDGGVWLDNIEYSDGEWYGWDTLQTFDSVTGGVVTNLANGEYTLSLQAFDGSEYGARSPSFSVFVDAVDDDVDDDGLPNDWEMQYFGTETAADPAAMASNGVDTILQAYVADLDPTNATAFFNVTELDSTTDGFVVHWVPVEGRVYSVYRAINLTDGFTPAASNLLWPQSSWTDTVNRVEGFYQIEVQLQE